MRNRRFPTRVPSIRRWGYGSMLLFATLGVASLVGCRDQEDGRVRLRMAYVYELNSPTHLFGTSRLNQELEDASSDLRVTLYPAAQLGNEEELLEQLVAGELDLAITGPSFLAMWHRPLGVFDAAFAFTSQRQMLQVADGDEIRPHWDQLRERFGIRVLATWAYGERHLTANRPIRHPSQLKGFRLRLPAARVWQESGAALGASPMPLPFSEVYMALQQGVADGQENPIPVIQSMGFQEVQKYLMLTGHIQSSIQVLVNEQRWQRLTPKQQHNLRETIRMRGEDILAGIELQEGELLDRWQHDGTLQIIDDVDIAAFRKRAHHHFRQGFDFSPLYRQINNL